jgi:hypothetical protein
LGPIVRAVRPHVEDEFARLVMKAAQDDLGPAYWIPAAVAALVMLVLGLVPRLPRRARLIGMGLVMVLAVNFHIAPAYFRIVQEPIKEAALLARERGYEVTLYEFRRPSFLFYQRSLAEEGLPRPGDVVVTTADRIDTFHEVETLYRKNGVVLARVVHLVKPRGGRRDER